MEINILPPPYDLDLLKTVAKRRLQEEGGDPTDALQIYWMIAKLRGEQLRQGKWWRRGEIIEGEIVAEAPAPPPARDAKEREPAQAREIEDV